jgi:hypothetical protein
MCVLNVQVVKLYVSLSTIQEKIGKTFFNGMY